MIRRVLLDASAASITTPIYNYDGPAAIKNLIELTGAAWKNQVIGFLCAAGGVSSFVSIRWLAKGLLEFRSVIVPRFVDATGESFAGGRIIDVEQARRVAELARNTASPHARTLFTTFPWTSVNRKSRPWLLKVRRS